MTREEAIRRINHLTNRNLYELAHEFEITISINGRTNKGWFGHIIERYLGLPLNSSQSPNFGSWELKTLPLVMKRNNILDVKETMAVTMLDPYNVIRTNFDDSHLKNKLEKMLIVTRIVPATLHGVFEFDLGELEIYNQIKSDYELIRSIIISQGAGALTGRLGEYVQPRTKGPGHGSISRAFYLRKSLLRRLVL